jgi:predicted  nucleic acid-binding Zn-ribbon protein
VALKSANDDAGSQHELVAALRAEGESLARKQSEMEKAVRAAKGEARELREALNAEVDAKDKALEKIANLEVELKTTKESLSAARKGESQAGKLESELAQAREDCNAKATTILSLEQQIKELKAETKELRTEVESSKRGATIETEREMAKLRKEHNEVIADLELKLRTSEREAGVREDALRHEVAELRKRWQDAVRRADGTFILSIMFILQDMKLVIRCKNLSNMNSLTSGWFFFYVLYHSTQYGCSVKHGSTVTSVGEYGTTKPRTRFGMGRFGRQVARGIRRSCDSKRAIVQGA